MALTFGLTRSMRARCAAMTSRAETCFRRMRAASSIASRWQRSSPRASTCTAPDSLGVSLDGASPPAACSVPPMTAAPTVCPNVRRLIARAESMQRAVSWSCSSLVIGAPHVRRTARCRLAPTTSMLYLGEMAPPPAWSQSSEPGRAQRVRRRGVCSPPGTQILHSAPANTREKTSANRRGSSRTGRAALPGQRRQAIEHAGHVVSGGARVHDCRSQHAAAAEHSGRDPPVAVAVVGLAEL